MDVLVVDDEAIARWTIENALQVGGYHVRTATNGREALELVKRHNIQLVVLDWEMPVMNGLEFCKAIRSGDTSHYVYVIMVTARNRPADTIAGLTDGADDYLPKPFHPGELLMRVKTGERVIGMESREMTIFALAKLAESRDPETGAHLERVRNYCRVLALHLRQHPQFQHEIDDDYVRLLYETSPLHDIGKVAIPDRILLKPGRLSDDEFEIMKLHVLRGAETIESLLQQFPNAHFLQMARNIILAHHEKYDGSGYPHRLSGGQIPLCGRIVAVADVYDALTSKRIYKEAYSHNLAASMIVADAGRHFDPAIVDAFVQAEQEFIRIKRQYNDDPAIRCEPLDTTAVPSDAAAANPAGGNP